MDHYNTLGVDRNATPDEIKKAYRKMAATHHPDKGGDTAAFQKVQQAYETLSDPRKKAEYDNPGFPGGGHQGGFSGGFPGGFQFHTNAFDINDIVGQMFGGGRAGPFGGPFGGSFQQNFKTTIWVTLEQVFSGDEQVLQMQGPNGIQTIKIKIPKGIEDGGTLRYEGLIPNGILLVEFRIHPHHRFERIGQDLRAHHKISVLDLIAGTSFDFITISGKSFTVQVKPKSQPDSILRISGQGLPHTNEHGSGDQLILLKPFIPDNIDNRIIDAIKQYQS